ncbi:MAG: hypothetical protein E3J72_04685, partial [Planctomycetota bacterium]
MPSLTAHPRPSRVLKHPDRQGRIIRPAFASRDKSLPGEPEPRKGKSAFVITLLALVLFFALCYTPAIAGQPKQNVLVTWSPLTSTPTANNHHFRWYNGTDISSELTSPAGPPDEATRIIARAHPLKTEYLIGHFYIGGDALYLYNASGTAESYTYQITNGGTAIAGLEDDPDSQPFDIAYEQLSGDGLIVYQNNSYYLCYRTYIDGVLSSEIEIDDATELSDTNNYRAWITLVPKPNSNEVALVYSTSSSSTYGTAYRVCVAIWNGSGWDSSLDREFTSTARTMYHRCFDACYEEGGDGDLVVAYGASSAGLKYWYLRSGTWNGEFSYDIGSTDLLYAVDLACEPGSDKIVAGFVEDSLVTYGLYGAARWSGGDTFADGQNLDITGHRPDIQIHSLPVAAGWYNDSGTYQPIIVYCDYNDTSLDWYYSANQGQTWSLGADATDPTVGYVCNFFLYPMPNGKLLLAIEDYDTNPDLAIMEYDGITWTNLLGGSTQLEGAAKDDDGWCICVAVGPELPPTPTINAWDSSGKGTSFSSGVWSNDANPYFEFNSSELGVEDVDGFYYKWDTGSWVWVADIPDNDCESWTVSPDISSDGTYYLFVMAHDTSGKNSTEAVYEYIYDSVGPTAPNPCYCEGQVNPSGVGDDTPEFSAVYNDALSPGTTYWIEVGDDNNWGDGAEMWSSSWTTLPSEVNIGEECSELSYAGGALGSGTSYYWRICFKDKAGNNGAWSATQEFSTLEIPQNFRCTGCSSTTLTWAWDDVASENGYLIYDNDTDSALVPDIAEDILEAVETGLAPNKTYRRYIRAYINDPLLEYYYAENLSEISTGATTAWQNICTLQFSPLKTADYVVIAAMQVRSSTTLSYYVESRLVRDEVSEINYGYEETDDYYHSFMGSEVLSASGSDPYKYQLQIKTTNASYPAEAQNAAIIAIHLPSSNYHNIDNLTEGLTTLGSFVRHSGVTVTPAVANDDYWVIHSSNCRLSAASGLCYSRLYDGTNELTYGVRDPYGVNEWFTRGGFSVLKGISSDVTLEAQYYRSTSTAYKKNVHITAIRLNDESWAGYADNALYTEQTWNNTTGMPAATKTFTVATPQNYLIMGSCSIGDLQTLSGYYPVAWLEHDCGSGTTVLGEMQFYEQDATTERASFAAMRRMYLTAGSHTVRVMFKRGSNSTTHYVRCPSVIAIPLEGVGSRNYSGKSNVVETCTAADVPTMDNTLETFIDRGSDFINVRVDNSSNPGNTAIELFYAPDAGGTPGSWISHGWNTTDYIWNVSGLSPGTSYWFRARAQNWRNCVTAYCDVTTCITAPPVPANFRVDDCSSTTITWGWDDVTGENGYWIYDNDTDAVAVPDIPADVLTTVETGLSVNTTYRRYIKSYTNDPLNYYYAENLNEVSTDSDSGWENACTLDMSPDKAGDYLVIAAMQGKSHSTLGYYGLFRFVRDETNVINYAFEETDDYYHSFMSSEILSASGSDSYKYQLQIRCELNLYTTTAQNAAIIAILLPTNNYACLENMTQGSVQSPAFANHSTLEVTPYGTNDDYLVIHSSNFSHSTAGDEGYSQLKDLSGGNELTYSCRDPYNDANEIFTQGGFSVLKGISSSVTLASQIRSYSLSYLCYENNVHITAIRLSDSSWAGYADNALYTEQTTLSTIGEPAATKTFTVTTPQYYLIMGSCGIGTSTVTQTYWPFAWLEHEYSSTVTKLGELQFDERAAVTERASFAAMRRMYLAAGSHTVRVMFKRTTSGTASARCPAVIAIPLEGDGIKIFSYKSNVAETCTAADVPVMGNSAGTFIARESDSITVEVDNATNPAGTGIELFCAPDSGGVPGSWVSKGLNNTDYTWNVSGLTADSVYWFRARAQNWRGCETAYCDVTTWATLSLPPANFRFTDCSSTTLTWAWDD